MHKATKNIIVCSVLAVVIMTVLFSCGKRITTIEKHYIKSDSLVVQNSVQLVQNVSWNDIGSVKPFDASKPMFWGGKWYYNTIIEFDKSIKSGIDIKANESLSYTGSESESKEKNVESNNRNFLWIGITFVIGILFVLYLSLKKYKIL